MIYEHSQPVPDAWSCAEFSFSPSLGHLYIEGEYKHLSPKVSAVFAVLCANSPRVINKLDILDSVWKNQEISDTAVADAVRTIRQSLNHQKALLGTVPKQGYRISKKLQVISIGEFEQLADLETNLLKTNKNKWMTPINGAIAGLLLLSILVLSWSYTDKQPTKIQHQFDQDIYKRSMELNARYNLKDNDKAIKLVRDGLKNYPNSPKLLSALSLTYMTANARYAKNYSVKEFKNLAEKATKLDPMFAPAWHSFGLAYANEYNSLGAIENLKKAIALDPNYSDAYNSLGLVEHGRGNMSHALKYYMKSLEIDKSTFMIYTHIGNVYRDVGLYDLANQWYQQSMLLAPEKQMDKHSYYYNFLFQKKYTELRKILNADKQAFNADKDFKSFFSIQLATYSGDHELAIKLFNGMPEKDLEANSNGIVICLLVLPYLDQSSDDYKRAFNYLDGLKQHYKKKIKVLYKRQYVAFLLSQFNAIIGETDESVLLLTKAIDSGFRDIKLLDMEPAHQHLFGNAEFDQQYQRIQNLVDTERDQILHDFGL